MRRAGVFASTVRVAEYDPDRPLAIGDATISFAPAVHHLPAWAMRVAAPGAADLAHTGDTGPTAGLARFFAGAAVVVAEATLPEPAAKPRTERKSLTATEAGELAHAAGAGVLVLTHLRQELGFETARAAAFPGRLELVRPGLVVDW